MAVDANRDGVVKYVGSGNNPAAQGKPTDKTDETKPFRFWLNDDNDGTEDGSEVIGAVADSSDNEIKSYRDLEDFTRLQFYIGGLQDAIRSGDIEVGLEWRNVQESNPQGVSPSIKIYRAAEAIGGDKYLRNDNNKYYAALQTATPFKTALGTIDGNGGFKFPRYLLGCHRVRDSGI